MIVTYMIALFTKTLRPPTEVCMLLVETKTNFIFQEWKFPDAVDHYLAFSLIELFPAMKNETHKSINLTNVEKPSCEYVTAQLDAYASNNTMKFTKLTTTLPVRVHGQDYKVKYAH